MDFGGIITLDTNGITVNVNGTLKKLTAVTSNVNGTLKKMRGVSVNVAGVIQDVYGTSLPGTINVDMTFISTNTPIATNVILSRSVNVGVSLTLSPSGGMTSISGESCKATVTATNSSGLATKLLECSLSSRLKKTTASATVKMDADTYSFTISGSLAGSLNCNITFGSGLSMLL